MSKLFAALLLLTCLLFLPAPPAQAQNAAASPSPSFNYPKPGDADCISENSKITPQDASFDIAMTINGCWQAVIITITSRTYQTTTFISKRQFHIEEINIVLSSANQIDQVIKTLPRPHKVININSLFGSLDSLPGNINKLTDLQKINLEWNNPQFPPLWETNRNLENIHIYTHHNIRIPSEVLQMTKLKSLGIDGNVHEPPDWMINNPILARYALWKAGIPVEYCHKQGKVILYGNIFRYYCEPYLESLAPNKLPP